MATTSARTTDQASTIGDGTRLEGIRHKVFVDRYALKGEDGTPLEEYPEQMWRRVAAGIAAVEPTVEKRSEWTEKFYDLLRDFKFVPGGRILSGAGAGHQVTFYNCFVVGLGEDPLAQGAPRKPMLDPSAARPAFFNALAQMTDIMSRSGGVGMNLSALPPKGTPITADGRGRHGPVRPTVALSLSHPDVGRLLEEKDGPNLAHVDVAVIVPPEFDQALADDADWTPRWGDMRGETVRARELWERVTADHGRRAILLRPDTAMLAIDDSRDAIVGGAAEAAMALFHGEAPVVDFSRLRPKGAYIKTVNGTSSGPVAWMYLYDAVARADDGAAPTEKGVVWFGEIASVITGKTIQQGGCFGPDQRIATSRGLLRAAELADLIDAGEKVDALTHEGPRPITCAFRNGTKPLYRVTTARGFTVDVTPEHKMGVLRKGKLATVPLEELEVGDEVLLFLGEEVAGDYVPLASTPYRRSIMSTRLNEDVRLPDVLDEKLAYVLGYLHGDGYVHWGRKVTWRAPKAIKLATADAYPAIRDQLVEYARDLFGIEPIVEDHTGEACKTVALYSRVLIDWLQHNGLLKAHSDAVRVPEKIFRSPSSVMAAFIAGYFDADGSDRGRKSGYGFDSVSLDLLRDIQQLLAANGILSHIHTADRSALGWRTIHRLVVTGAEFKARMNLFMHMALKNRARAGFRNHRNGYPRDVWPELGVPGRYYQGLWDSTKPDISYRALSRVQDRLVLKGEVALAERVKQLLHTVPDHIVSIEALGESEVYDFEVADVHMLSGNGVYTSNSRRGAL
ncbi:MAG TPA: ribonucleotide reductase N-terminal alpha domain-containing protein, partial [Chloroflexota bacterium]|nr:ribonucleotide reductase N-terminal alpha domain-containing protein [Chloroflexota bacterium]